MISLKSMGGNLLDIIYPPLCVFCRRPCRQIPRFPRVCRSCLGKIPLRLNPVLDHDNLRLPAQLGDNLILCCAAYYREPLRQALIRLKFSGSKDGADLFAELIYNSLHKVRLPVSVVVPVPLHKKRLRERGYNQSALIARGVAARLNTACEEDLLIRQRNTGRQSEQPGRAARMANPAGAFELSKTAMKTLGIKRNERIILVDDVLTTGATMLAAAEPFLREGIAVVGAAVASNKP